MKCPICKSRKVSSLNNINSYYYCLTCKTAWLKKKLVISYSKDYYEPKSKLAGMLFGQIAFILYKLRGLYFGFRRANTWIDYGSGDGSFLKTVSANHKIGVEISTFEKNKMKKYGITMISPSEFLKTPKDKTDVISLWHVIEHLENPLKHLKSFYKILPVNGKLIVAAPNIDSLEFKVFNKFWFNLFPQFHIWHFSTNSLKMIIEKAGFKIDYIDYFAPEHHFASCLQSFINATASKQNILLELLKRHVNKDNPEIKFKDVFWSIFWTTIGIPIVIVFWFIASLVHKPSAVVIVAVK